MLRHVNSTLFPTYYSSTYLLTDSTYTELARASQNEQTKLASEMYSTVEPRFTNLIRSWRPFVNRNVRKPKLS
jgi:hypothetical protein